MGILLLCSCGGREGLVPVVEIQWRSANNHAQQHIVERGETLYAIAFRYDQDYRQLAIKNHLRSPFILRVGQVVRLQAGRPTSNLSYIRQNRPVQYAPPTRRAVMRPVATVQPKKQYNSGWLWPIRGRVVVAYAPLQGKKGIDIAGSKGDRVHAASGGIVAYAGNGLSGYGNLIIIKHDNQFLTAYGNNARNLVREGQHVKAGQAIAIVGVVERRYWGLHFEIRKAGTPVNPLNYLQSS